MTTLGIFLKEKLPEFETSVFLEYGSGVYVQDIHLLLSNISLVPHPNSKRSKVPSILVSKSEFFYHTEIIDLILEYILEKKIKNVLVLGYVDGYHRNSSKNHVFKGHNSVISMLKSKPMEIIKQVLGNDSFLDLIFNYNATWIPNNLLIWGELKEKSFKDVKYIPNVNCRSMLYINTFQLKYTNPVVLNPEKLLSKIFSDVSLCKEKKFVLPRRYRKVVKLLKSLIRNHSLKMKQYPYIADQICSPKNNAKDFLSMSIDKEKVIRFIMTIVYKVIPVSLFGTVKNRTTIMRYIPKIINGTVFDRFKLSQMLHNIKLNQVLWVKPRDQFKMTKHEFTRAKSMFLEFIYWLFKHFISRLVSGFFYVTEASQKSRLLFFRHFTWRRISKKFMSQYFSTHLINRKDNENTFESFIFNKDIIGRISLLPKKNNFRLIVKPFKGTKEELIAYKVYQKRLQKPMLQILHEVRSPNGCGSVSDIIKHVYEFKKKLLTQYNGSLPKIYTFKFDVKNAYDSLPHNLIASSLEKRLAEYTKSDKIHVQLFKELDKCGFLSRNKRIVVDSLSKLSIFSNKSASRKLLVDSNETFSFSKEQIVNFVKRQYTNTCIHTKSKSYYRHVGVYQGYPFSGLLFNLVYDCFVEELYDYIDKDNETVIIRIMDDFLIISTKLSVIKKLRALTARTIKKYNMNVNRLKTEISTDEVSFAGLDIDVQRLLCYKTLRKYNNAPINTFSFDKLYKILIQYFEMRLSDNNLFNTSILKSGPLATKQNVLDLFKAIIFKFCNSYKITRTRSKFSLEQFKKFLTYIIKSLQNKVSFDDINCDVHLFEKISLRILKHKNIIHKLDQDGNILNNT